MLRNPIAPDLLEILETGNAGDIDFYCQYARLGGGPVLVLLCSTGRIAISIAGKGTPVVGLDTEVDMIEHAKRKAQQAGVTRAMFVRGDPTNFVSDTKYALVIIPGGSLQRMLSLEEQAACLTAARHSLQIGGRLVMDLPLFVPGAQPDAAPIVRRQGATGDQVTVIHRHRTYDPTRQLAEDLYRCDWLSPDGQVGRTQYSLLTSRYSTVGEVQLLLSRCGFAAEIFGGFDRQPLLPGAERLVVEACWN